MRKLFLVAFCLYASMSFGQDGQAVDIRIPITGGSVGNADSLGGQPADFYVDTATNQNISGLKIFKDDLVLDSTLGIGGTPDPSAILDITSTTKGVVFPRMTNTQRDAITVGTAQKGLKIYSLNNNGYHFYNGTEWKKNVFTPANTLSTIGGVAFVIDTTEIHADTNFIWDNTLKRLGLGTKTPRSVLEVKGSLSGTFGQLSINNNSATTTANAVITGIDSLGNRLWYVGGGAGADESFSVINARNSFMAFSTNATEKVRIEAGGNVGIGTPTPGAKLEIAGQVKITGGGPGVGKVLTSDATGLGNWTLPSGGGWTDSGTELILTNINDNVAIGNSTAGNQKLIVRGTSPGAIGDGNELIEFRDDRTTTGSAPNYILAINRQNSTTAAWYLGNDGNNSPIIAANNKAMRFGNDVSGVFTETMNLSTTGALSGLNQLTVDNIRLDGNTISSTTGDIDVVSASGGVFKFTSNAFQSGQDASNFLEIGHGGSNSFVNQVGVGGMDFRFAGTTKATFTSAGHLHLLTDTDQKHNLKIITNNNANASGIAWENSGGNFSQTIFREDVGSNRSDLVFAIGSNADIDLLTSAIRLDGSIANEGNVEFFKDIILTAYPNTRDDGTPINILGTDASGNLISGPNEVIHIGGNFVDTLDQSIAISGTPQSVTFNKNLLINDVSHTTGSDIFTINTDGVYNIIVAPQLSQGTGTATVEFWIEKNGTVIPHSNVQETIGSNSQSLPLLRWKERFVATDTFKIIWASNSTNTMLDNIVSSYGGPNIPSIMLGVTHVGS